MQTSHLWQEVFKAALAETDIVLEILDCRNPTGTHNVVIEQFLAKQRPGVEVLLILNKIDMVPKNVARAWVEYFLAKKYHIFAVSARYKQGILELLQKIRFLGKKDQLNCLIVGYPNTGKSTLIEALTQNRKKVGTSPLAGFTRTIKKIKLNNNIYLIDTPGVIPIDEHNETDIAIKACMTAEKVSDPLAVVEAIFQLLPKHQFEKLYDVKLTEEDGPEELIEKVGRRLGRLISGGHVNEDEVQKTIIRDWQANRLRYYMIPPGFDAHKNYADKEIDQDIGFDSLQEKQENKKNND
jgi:ribosome biogenesis GTPase A